MERKNLVEHFVKQFDDVLITERGDLDIILLLIDRLYQAEQSHDQL